MTCISEMYYDADTGRDPQSPDSTDWIYSKKIFADCTFLLIQ